MGSIILKSESRIVMDYVIRACIHGSQNSIPLPGLRIHRKTHNFLNSGYTVLKHGHDDLRRHIEITQHQIRQPSRIVQRMDDKYHFYDYHILN